MKKTPKLTMNPAKEGKNDINLYILDPKTFYTKTHTHDFFEVMVVAKGKIWQRVNGEERILSENDICILRPEAVHAVNTYEDHPLVLLNFEVNIDYLNSLCKVLGLSPADDIFTAPVTYTHCVSGVLDYIKIITIPHVFTNLIHLEIQQASLKIILTQILVDFIVNPTHSLPPKSDNPLISTMLELMEDKENFSLSIKEICEKTFYTQEHITRLFRSANMDTPNRIHLQKKLQYAANLLLSTDTKIINIAEECGIETISYFTKAFKREYGVSPAAYRRMYRGNIMN